MLRSFEQLCQTAKADLLIAADAEHAAVVGGNDYAMPWHWHDCLMFILPSRGAIELRHEGRREGTWLSQDRFASRYPALPDWQDALTRFVKHAGAPVSPA